MSAQGEGALIQAQNKIAQQAELSNLIQLSQLDGFNEFSDDIHARIVRLTGLRKNGGLKGW